MMRNFRILYVACVVVLLCCLVAPLAPAAADAAPDEPSSPYVVFPKDEDVFTTTPKFRFTKFPGVTKYRIDIWEGDDFDAPPIYTFKFAPSCSGGECWYKPDIKLKNYDFSGENGEYSWRIRAKEGTGWPPLWSQTSFRVLSSGFTSTFDVNANKWQELAGDWTLTSKGYLKTLGDLGYVSSVIEKHSFVNGYVYEVKMKRKGDDMANTIAFNADPYPLDVTKGWHEGYFFQYKNDGYWSLYKYDNGVAEAIFPWTYSSYIHPNDWNTLTVMRTPTSIKLWINGQWLNNIGDDTFGGGFVGFGMFEGSDNKSPLLVDSAWLEYTTTNPYPTDLSAEGEIAP